MFNKKLKFKVSVSHRSGAVAALEGVQKTSLSARHESVAMGWTSGDLVCAVSRAKMRQQRSHR